MTDSASHMDLSGKLLIAMPGMGDPRFDHAVIYLCAHSEDGAMGLIVNQAAADLAFGDLLEQLEIDASDESLPTQIHVGGPVEHGRGFVLHSGEYDLPDSTLRVDADFGMTATLEVLEDMAMRRGPARALLALGYSGWAPGQLEDEIGQNGWLTCDASPDLVFGTENAQKWEKALAVLGVDPLTLSASAGRA
ncbi:YqgE/AlgH family protein [Tropicimonas sp. TH_r6]|uniref:YqgE/AlgH family protein n=1 Tax=Tropicimonas sp. TH_r6 TaxID=3082085 RepID=UPI002952CEC1|nr:YqgE/AlgH family protein [Tropicimonas sp. TH_r6]MDV7142223.1 YqgE/AlgH family protein [Tropicimonas sp. TH_r6]